jgi:endogenous inhibitor of DNA gyrase (YacG/DUF329 family)
MSKTKKCPICQEAKPLLVSPFCSVKCQETDLQSWLGGTYRLPTQESAGSPGDENN